VSVKLQSIVHHSILYLATSRRRKTLDDVGHSKVNGMGCGVGNAIANWFSAVSIFMAGTSSGDIR
jgi:hypothetical protein